jgi:hypothetical protein
MIILISGYSIKMPTIKKVYRKTFGRKSPYKASKTSSKITKIAAQVAAIKMRLNTEKKHIDRDVQTGSLGQAYENADGIYYTDITPIIAQGVDSDERVGNSLKLTGISIPIQFAQQTSTLGDRKVRIDILRVKSADNDVTALEAAQQVWDLNPLTGLRDYDAPRAYRSAKSDGISIVRSTSCFVKGPHLETGDNGTISNREINVKNMKINLKLNDTCRFASSSSTTPDGVKYFLIIRCNAGNSSSNNTTGLDIPITDNTSGLQVRIAQRTWWVDN